MGVILLASTFDLFVPNVMYTLPQKKHNFSQVAFLLEKIVGR